MKGDMCGQWQGDTTEEMERGLHYSCYYELGMYLWDRSSIDDDDADADADDVGEEGSEKTCLKRVGPFEYQGFRIAHGDFTWYHEVRLTISGDGRTATFEWPAILSSVS